MYYYTTHMVTVPNTINVQSVGGETKETRRVCTLLALFLDQKEKSLMFLPQRCSADAVVRTRIPIVMFDVPRKQK